MKRTAIAGVVALVACNETQESLINQLNLDRPIDIAFACYGGLRLTEGLAADPAHPVVVGAQPVQSCNKWSEPAVNNVKPRPAGQEDLPGKTVPNVQWLGFILQSGPGTVAIAEFDTKPSTNFGGEDVVIIDADPLMPGKNSISVGENPIAIATDKIGCFEVIANQGSCDLSELSIESVYTAEPIVNRLEVKNAAGTVIRARPAAMAFEPGGGIIGQNYGTPEAPASCPAQATGLAYIAYPSCHLVAGVDVATGTIVTGIQFDANGVPTIVDGSVTCPAECDGEAVTPGVRPVALDLEIDKRTGRALLAIGADNSNDLAIYELDTTQFRPQSLIPVSLEDPNMRLGVTSLSISPVIGMGGVSHDTIVDDGAPGGDWQFVYAVATDGSVRVASVMGAARECETQIDPRYIWNITDPLLLPCFPIGDPATPRRAGARGPGIELIGEAIPTSVDVFRTEMGPETFTGPETMIGYFGVITAASGGTYIFNVDDDNYEDSFADILPIDGDVIDRTLLAKQVPLMIPHQLRDNVPKRDLEAVDGDGELVCDDAGPNPDQQTGNEAGPRATSVPARIVPSGVLAQEKITGLPILRQVMCTATSSESVSGPVSELFFSAPVATRVEVFPDLRALRIDENWSLTWEGSLSLDKVDTSIDGPAIRTSQISLDAFGMHLVDFSHPYCDAGVEQWDVVQLRGCDPAIGDAGCPSSYTCYVHPQSQLTGLGACILESEAERLQNACEDFLTSLRRYTVGRAKTGELKLLPRKNVLRTTPIDGCVDDLQCHDLASYALENNSPSHPIDDQTPEDTHTWACQVDPDRAPLAGTGKRCIQTCEADTDCSLGTVCLANPDSPRTGYCMEGVMPPQACVNAPQRYEIRAGQAFTMIGSRSGYQHATIADAAGNCIKDPNANPFLVSRIPLSAPPCDPLADPRTGKRMNGTYEPNPCQLTVPQAEYQLNYVPNTCTLNNPDTVVATRDAVGIRIRNRNMQLTLVDPTYPGDLRCIGDRGGPLVNVPIVTPGFALTFRQTAGFTPKLIGIRPSFPIKVVRGPTESVWVIDEGDFLSTSIATPSTRGEVFRVESGAIGVINALR